MSLPSPTPCRPDPSPATHTPTALPPSPTPPSRDLCSYGTTTLTHPRDPPPVVPPPSPTPHNPCYHGVAALTHPHPLYRSPPICAPLFIFFPSGSQNSLNIKEREREAPLPPADSNASGGESDGSDGGSWRWWKPTIEACDGGSPRWWKPTSDDDGDAVASGKRRGKSSKREKKRFSWEGKRWVTRLHGKGSDIDLM
uniref:Vegetative cell wall protein gp1-like n=1 Tax=Elaeis guineensis var. tenera TaxID=51953 RepID=A0A6I9QLX5_ELAGV